MTDIYIIQREVGGEWKDLQAVSTSFNVSLRVFEKAVSEWPHKHLQLVKRKFVDRVVEDSECMDED